MMMIIIIIMMMMMCVVMIYYTYIYQGIIETLDSALIMRLSKLK